MSTWRRRRSFARCIREAGEEVSDQELHDLWHDARDEIGARGGSTATSPSPRSVGRTRRSSEAKRSS